MKHHMIIPIFVPHLGCPYDCVFCNQKKISGTLQSMDEGKVRNQIETYLSTAKSTWHIEIAFLVGLLQVLIWTFKKNTLILLQSMS